MRASLRQSFLDLLLSPWYTSSLASFTFRNLMIYRRCKAALALQPPFTPGTPAKYWKNHCNIATGTAFNQSAFCKLPFGVGDALSVCIDVMLPPLAVSAAH